MKKIVYKKEKLLSIVLSTFCALNMAACSREDNEKTTETTFSSAETVSEVTETTPSSSETELTTSKPTGFEAKLDETIPCNSKNISNEDFMNLRLPGYYLGFDSPMLLQNVRTLFNDPNITIEELQYLQPSNLSKSFDGRSISYYENHKDIIMDVDLVRYVLEENNLRFWIDEIPYEYFDEKFPEVVEYYKTGRESELYAIMDSEEYQKIFLDDKFHRISLLDVGDIPEDLSFYTEIEICDRLMEYNATRFNAATLYSAAADKYIPIARSVDGKNVLVPDERQYERIKGIYGFEILSPEERDSLVLSGVPVDSYDSIFEKTIGSAKMSNQNDVENAGKSKTR